MDRNGNERIHMGGRDATSNSLRRKGGEKNVNSSERVVVHAYLVILFSPQNKAMAS
jgi:hypothetical protein